MRTAKIANTNLQVSRVGLGCVTFGREIDENTSFQVLDYALSKGITFLDTAEAYGGGQARAYRKHSLGVTDIRECSNEWHSSEKILGRWLSSRKCRDKVILQTKLSPPFTRAQFATSLTKSLERLQTETIDICLFHQFDASTPMEESLEAMTEAIQACKVRVAGCSNFNFNQLQESWEISDKRGLAPLQVIQPMYSLLNREIEAQILPFCRRRKIAVVSYSPLAAGFLTGKYNPDKSQIPKGSRFDVIPAHIDLYFSRRNFEMVSRLKELSARTDVPMSQLALSWVLSNPDLASVLVGARSTLHVDNALDAIKVEFRVQWRKELEP